MANYYGPPAIVTDGLIFAVDAGNGQSYVSGSLKAFDLVSSNTGSLINQAQYSPVGNGSWAFDGSDDYIPLVSTIPLDTIYTISLWVIYVSGNRVSFGGSSQYALYVSGTTLYHRNSWDIYSKTFSDIGDGNWHNICLSRDGGTMTWYADGVSLGTSSTSGTLTLGTVGAYDGGSYGWLGKIAKILVYDNKALSEAEVLQNYNATKGRFT